MSIIRKLTGINKDYSISVLYSDILLCILSFVAFLSVDIPFVGIGNLRMPSEPILMLLCMVFAFVILGQKTFKEDIGIYKRGQSFWNMPLCLGLYIVWLWISSIFSDMPIIALKASAAFTWCVIPAFYLVYKIQRENSKTDFGQKLLFYALMGLSVVSVYGIINYIISSPVAINRFFLIPKPFLSDHTHWGALIAMFLFVALYLSIYGRGKGIKALSSIAFFILIIALWTCKSRAAMLSIIPSVGLFGLLYLYRKSRKIRLIAISVIVVLSGIVAIVAVKNYGDIENKSINWTENMLSLVNYNKESSSKERINRWSCAYRITKDYPVFGSGRGTYQFVYGPYQREDQITGESSLTGSRGNAHSEYLSAFSETGIVGGLLFLIVVIVGFGVGIKSYIKTYKDKDIQSNNFILTLLLALLTYFIHAFFNNFLYIDSSCIVVFIFFALLSAEYFILNKKSPLQRKTAEDSECINSRGKLI